MNQEQKSFVKVFFAGCLWGTIGLFVKLMEAQGSTPDYTSFLRLLLGFLLLAALTLAFEGPKAFLVSRRTLLSCALLGVVGVGLFNMFYSSSISLNGMAVGSVLLYTAPVFTTVMSILVFGERLNGRKWGALLMNVLGCILTATGGNFSGTTLLLAGILFGVGAGFTYGMVPVLGRIAMKEQSSTFAPTAYNLLFGALFVALVRRPWNAVANPLRPRLLLIGLLYALIPTALAYIFYFGGVARIRQTSKVPVVASIELVVATLIGVTVFREAIGVWNIVGIVLVLLSILLFSGKAAEK